MTAAIRIPAVESIDAKECARPVQGAGSMKFYELRKGQAFRFPATEDEPAIEAVSAGVDGAYGRFVATGQDWRNHDQWHYCRPTAEVEAIEEKSE